MLVIPVVVVTAAIVLACSYVISLRGFAEIEQSQAEQHTQRLAAGLQAELREIDADVVDYSAWDDTCAYVAGDDPTYPERNLVDSLFDSFRLNLVMILDASGEVVWGGGYDLASGNRLPAPPALFSHLSQGSPLVAHDSPESATSGSLRIGAEQWLLASRPILDSNEEGPLRGTVVMGRVLDEAYLSQLSARLGQQLSLRTVVGGFAEGDFLRRQPSPQSAQPLTEISPDGEVVVGSVVVADIYGQPSLVLDTEIPRDIYEQGKTSVVAVTHILVLTLAILAGALVIILERSVLSPLSGLAQQVRKLRLGELTRLNLRQGNSSELTVLADEVNDLVEELEASRSRLQGRYKEAKELADRDPLTGLLNHRALFEYLERELHRARRTQRPLSLVLMDFDDFKQVNDHYGHLMGDEVLRRVGALISVCARSGDVLGRYGGDEFVAILPGADREEATRFAERILHELAKQDWGNDAHLAPGLSVMLSCGVASFPECGEEVNELIAHADANLYRAKAAGGGTITVGPSCGDAHREDVGAFGILEGLVAAINNKDRYTRRHSEEVASYAVAIAESLGLSEDEQRSVRIAGLLHDVGKIGVPEDVLRKPGALDPAERAIVERHVEIGELLIKDIPHAETVREAVASHHERWDGAGYPRGLTGSETPLAGRILAVADAFSAMTSRRPYRDAQSREDALGDILRVKGSQLDPDLVDVLVAAAQESTQSMVSGLRPMVAG